MLTSPSVDVVVGAGRGFGAEEDELQMARDLWLLRSAANSVALVRSPRTSTGCRRNLYIGVSGLQLAPKAYIALGISGQMQHMVGVTGADTIIAVNKDAERSYLQAVLTMVWLATSTDGRSLL